MKAAVITRLSCPEVLRRFRFPEPPTRIGSLLERKNFGKVVLTQIDD